MIKFEDFFKVDGIDTSKIKIKFNMNADNKHERAWDFLKYDDGTPQYNRWIDMNSYKMKHANNNLNKATYLMAFAQYYPLGYNYYIFGGMYKVEKILPEVFDTIGYKLTLMDEFKEYRRRVIVKTKVPLGQSYNRSYDSVIEMGNNKLNPEIYEILPAKEIEDFPGFNKILLTHKDLQYIFDNDAPEWKRQLSSVKGVYCITDTSNGKIYIGSAYGDYAGIWQRWSEYANVKKLTGGNKAFEELKSIDCHYIIDNFTYSILEILDPRTPDNEIIQRESFWKDVFQTRKFGMNKN